MFIAYNTERPIYDLFIITATVKFPIFHNTFFDAANVFRNLDRLRQKYFEHKIHVLFIILFDNNNTN